MNYYVILHHHRFGTSALIVKGDEEPSEERAFELIEDFEHDRDDEYMEVLGPMEVYDV